MFSLRHHFRWYIHALCASLGWSVAGPLKIWNWQPEMLMTFALAKPWCSHLIILEVDFNLLVLQGGNLSMSTAALTKLPCGCLILRQGWHVPWRASGQEAPNWPVLKSLSSSSSVNEGLAFGLLPLLPFWTNLFRLASPQKIFLVQNRLNTMMQRTVTAYKNAAGLRKICKTWFGHEFSAGQFLSVRKFLIATTTWYFGFFLLPFLFAPLRKF